MAPMAAVQAELNGGVVSLGEDSDADLRVHLAGADAVDDPMVSEESEGESDPSGLELDGYLSSTRYTQTERARRHPHRSRRGHRLGHRCHHLRL